MKVQRAHCVLIVAGLAILLYSAPLNAMSLGAQEQPGSLASPGARVFGFCSAGVQPFQLRAAVRFFSATEQAAEGKYLLICVSPDQWREEMAFRGGFRQATVKLNGQVRRVRTTLFDPWRVKELQDLMWVSRRGKLVSAKLGEKLHERKRGRIRGQCGEVSDRHASKHTYCFDPDTGALTGEEHAGLVYQYGDYSKWGDRLVPRSLRAFEGKELAVEVHVNELAPASSPPQELFQLTGDTESMPACEDPEPPKILDAPAPLERYTFGSVVLYATVEADGTLKNQTLLSPNSPFAGVIMKDLRRWHLQPERCSGVPVRSEVLIEVGGVLAGSASLDVRLRLLD